MISRATAPIHIVGRRHHGKTTLIARLIPRFSSRGIRVGTIKHSSHFHELDTEGKATYQHREAGASPVAAITRGLSAVYLHDLSDQDCYDKLMPLFDDCDLLLIEGDLERKGVKVEVWRKGLNTAPLASERTDIRAVITDDPVDLAVPVWPRADLDCIADRLLELARGRG
ncbi:MAG: molybdopterin-guanine dinucleotide biosynthesis protein B [Deltaproteobacteria bacterium]|nr:molybdopterin-guanine dinucleotide biosynthesis protein B [Deltaproteobacteria bacterium]